VDRELLRRKERDGATAANDSRASASAATLA
jgi:hypothetical protein